MKNNQHSRALWWSAIKPSMYTVAFKPMVLGALAAWVDHAILNLYVLCTWIFIAVCLIAWVNLTNDVFDFDTGIDRNKKESVVNLSGGTRYARNLVLFVATLILGLGALVIIWGNSVGKETKTNGVLISMAVAVGYAYQGPPFRLGYYGLGEPLTAIAWTLGTVASYNAQIGVGNVRDVMRRMVDRESCLGAIVGLVVVPTVLILFCSHFHQIDDDAKVGKKSPIVRLGLEKAIQVLKWMVVGLGVWEIAMWKQNRLDLWMMMASMASIPWAWILVRFVQRYKKEKEKVRLAKYYAVKWHFVHTVLLAVAMTVVGWNRHTGGKME